MPINTAIVTIDEPFYIPKMINSLLKMTPQDMKYVLIVLVPVRPMKFSEREFIFNQLQVYGISQFIKMSTLYINHRILSLGKSGEKYSIKKTALKNDIEIVNANTLKDPLLLNTLKRYSVDIILSIASSRIFGKSIISIPKIACLNVHAGILPRYRGINPSFWSLLNKEKVSAVTVHYINEGIDDGDIIKQDIFSIENLRSLHELYLKILDVAPYTVTHALQSIKNGNVKLLKNDRSISDYYSFPKREDGIKFRKMGLKFI
jgi:methionyl-tRNA formyltransferase